MYNKPGELYKVMLNEEKDKYIYFLCTTVKQQANREFVYVGYTSVENFDFHGLNKFNIYDIVSYHDGECIDKLSIYYSVKNDKFKMKPTSIGLLKYIDNVLTFIDNNGNKCTNLRFMSMLDIRQLYRFYRLKDRCSYYIFKESLRNNEQDNVFSTGSVYKLDNEYLIAIRQGMLDNVLHGFYYRISDFANFTHDFHLDMETIKSLYSNKKISLVGYISPLYFRMIFDIYNEGGNIYLDLEDKSENILVKY